MSIDTGSKVARCLSALSETSLMCGTAGGGGVDSMIAYYRKRSREKRIWFRAASIALIALGASLPAVAVFGRSLPEDTKDILLSIMSAGIAFLTGILSHFRWEVGWRSQTEALFALKAERTAWDAAVVHAKLHPNEDQAASELIAAFDHLRTRTFEIAREERGKFFKTTALPPALKSHGS